MGFDLSNGGENGDNEGKERSQWCWIWRNNLRKAVSDQPCDVAQDRNPSSTT